MKRISIIILVNEREFQNKSSNVNEATTHMIEVRLMIYIIEDFDIVFFYY